MILGALVNKKSIFSLALGVFLCGTTLSSGTAFAVPISESSAASEQTSEQPSNEGAGETAEAPAASEETSTNETVNETPETPGVEIKGPADQEDRLPGSDSSEPTKVDPPVEKEPVKVDKPREEEPVKAETPAKEEPVKAETPAKEEPVKAEIPAKEEPVKAEIPAKEEPVKAEIPAKEEPVKAEIPAKEEPVKAEIPAKEEVVVKPAQTAVEVNNGDTRFIIAPAVVEFAETPKPEAIETSNDDISNPAAKKSLLSVIQAWQAGSKTATFKQASRSESALAVAKTSATCKRHRYFFKDTVDEQRKCRVETLY
jgi:hypothetical protein